MGENGLDIQGTYISKNCLRRHTAVCEHMRSDLLGQWFPRGDLPTRSICMTWELMKTANSQVHLRPTESETLGFGAQVCCHKALQEILTHSKVYGDL